jgi:hypothetical protein
MRDPDNTIVDRNRLQGISATSQLRQCCKSQLGLSVVQLGILAVGCSWRSIRTWEQIMGEAIVRR